MDDILIVGASGEVGRWVARELFSDHPQRLVLGGRRLQAVAELAASLGGSVRAVALDVRDQASVAEALPRVGVVLSCANDAGRTVLRACVERGIAYTDITPHLAELQAAGDDSLEGLRLAAARSGARVVLGAGLVPGLSSVMAREARDRLGVGPRIETALLLTVGDVYGPASLQYILEEATRPFKSDGECVWPFSKSAKVQFPDSRRLRAAYRFPFSDQFFFGRTLGALSANSTLSLDPVWVGWIAAMYLRLSPTRFNQNVRVQRALLWAVGKLGHRRGGSGRYALVVTASVPERRVRASVSGQRQARGTAMAAAAAVRALAEGEVARSGAWFPEEVLQPETFFARLKKCGLRVHVEEA